MKRKNPCQPGLFDALEFPLLHAPTDEIGDCCLSAFGTNHCTLDGVPARVIGSPRSAPYAAIEPIDDTEPIYCHWDRVDVVMQDNGAFVRADDIDS